MLLLLMLMILALVLVIGMVRLGLRLLFWPFYLLGALCRPYRYRPYRAWRW